LRRAWQGSTWKKSKRAISPVIIRRSPSKSSAILQPPFFNLEADEAVNYGAIGAVIGHEVGHGFDDKGSTFDGDGKLRNWWTDEDRVKIW